MSSIPILLTEEQPCSYLDTHIAQSAFIHPSLSVNQALYHELIANGFRRSGNEVYTPHCPTCSECIPTRILVAAFTANKNQRRCLKKNKNTTVCVLHPCFEPAHYAMYLRYQKSRHPGGSMDNLSEKDYINCFASRWCTTRFVEFSIDGVLAAIAVVDLLEDALSAVYTFFEPQFAQYSLGNFALLWQIKHAAERRLNYIYTGYWIKNCQKMAYKIHYQPLECFIENEWKIIRPDKR